MREVISDLVADAVPETYPRRIAEASLETGIPEAVIDNRFRRERGVPEIALRRNGETQRLVANARRAAADLPDNIELGGWTPASGIIVELGDASLGFVGYDPFQSGDMFLVEATGVMLQLRRGDPRIENVLKQISISFSTQLATGR